MLLADEIFAQNFKYPSLWNIWCSQLRYNEKLKMHEDVNDPMILSLSLSLSPAE